MKAHPHRRLTFHDIVIQSPDRRLKRKDGIENQGNGNLEPSSAPYLGSGPPTAIVKGDGKMIADQMARISISHDGEYAVAVCMGFDPKSKNTTD